MTSPADYQEKISSLETENIRLNNEVENLSSQLKWFKKQLFGRKSERRIPDAVDERQLCLGEQFRQKSEEEEETRTVAEHQRKKKRPLSFYENGRKLFFDDSVPIEEIMVDNPEVAGLNEDEFEVIGQKETYRLAQRPGAYVILKYVRNVVKIKSDNNEDGGRDEKITCPPVPGSVFEKSHADASFLAGLLIDKFQYHLPLYRQNQRLAGSGVHVSRGWLTQLAHRCGDLLEPIVDAQMEAIRRSRVKLMDETPIKAGRKKKGKMREAYFWPVMGGDQEIVFLYFNSREHRHVFEALGAEPEDDSVIVSDGYAAYREYAKATDTLNAQCWVHSRREFIKAEEAEPALTKEALDLMRPLWKIEKEIEKQGLKGEAKRMYRLEHSKPVVEKFFLWVNRTLANDALWPSNLLTHALGYVNKRREALEIFLTDPDVPIDTNELERALRVIPMGRKNWMFCWTEVGAKYVGIFQSLIVTCKMHGIAPYTYLVDVLQRVADHPKNEVEKLTPANWCRHFAQNPLRSHIDQI